MVIYLLCLCFSTVFCLKVIMNKIGPFVQTDLKRLLRNPPLVKIPKIRDLISANPLLGALPVMVRETLAESTKEIMKLSGTTLYGEGSKPAGIWLISNGVVKVHGNYMCYEFNCNLNLILIVTDS